MGIVGGLNAVAVTSAINHVSGLMIHPRFRSSGTPSSHCALAYSLFHVRHQLADAIL